MQQRFDLEGLFEAHAARVRRVLARRGIRPADLPDVEQEVFLVAHRKLAELEVRSSLLGWLLGIAANVASEHRRKASYRRERVGLPGEPACQALDPLAHLQAAERRARVHRWLEALSPEQREVVVLHDLSELSMHEVARELRVPLKTAFSRLYAAHRALRRVAAREQVVRPRRGIGAALAGLALGFKWLPRAQAALLPVPAAALMFVAASIAAPAPLSLTSASNEQASYERLSPGSALSTKLAPERGARAAATPRASSARTHAASAPPASSAPEGSPAPERALVVLRVDQDFALARLPYPHPFEERAFTIVDPTTVKPRLVIREAGVCDPARSPCAL